MRISIFLFLFVCMVLNGLGQSLNHTFNFFKKDISSSLDVSSLAISGDGTTLAISTKGSGSEGSLGYVRVYRQSNQTWNQVGETLVGAQPGEVLGLGSSLSKDGQYLALGSTFMDGPAFNEGFEFYGFIQVYKLMNDTWVEYGPQIVSSESRDNFGFDLKLSNDGQSILIGAPRANFNFGALVTYSYNDEDWIQNEEPLTFLFKNNRLGWQVDADSDLKYVSVFQHAFLEIDADDDRVYIYNRHNDKWNEDFEITNNICSDITRGSWMEISDNGDRVVVFQCGEGLLTYERTVDSEFELKHSQQLSEYEKFYPYPCDMVMSDDGRHLIFYGDCEPDDKASSYRYTDQGWEVFSHDYLPPIDSLSDYHLCVLSDDGRRGVFAKDIGFIGSIPDTIAQVYVYDFSLGDVNGIAALEHNAIKIYPNPAFDKLNIDCEICDQSEVLSIRITNLLGIEVRDEKLEGKGVDVSEIPPGVYVISIKNQKGAVIAQDKILISN